VVSPAAGPTTEEIRAQAAADFAAGLKAATGYDSLSALKAAQDKAAADKLAEQGEFKQLAEQAQAELAQVKTAYQAERVRGAILGAASTSIDPDTVHALLAAQAQVGADGSVTIGGQPVAVAVEALLKAKPHLARPVGGQGSGAGGVGAGGSDAAKMTLAQLGELSKTNPATYQAEIARRAKIGGRS
jgi:hypothetical protein